MPTRIVDADELYPYFFLASDEKEARRLDYGDSVEFTDDEIRRIEAAMAEFDAVQDLMASRVGR